MNSFRRGTLAAAIALSVMFAVGIPLSMTDEHGLGTSMAIVSLALVAIWGTRIGANAVYRGIFSKGQEDERGRDTDFI